jgi:hypothetical protein
MYCVRASIIVFDLAMTGSSKTKIAATVELLEKSNNFVAPINKLYTEIPRRNIVTPVAISILRNYNTIEDYISDLKIAVIFSIAMRIIL